MKFNGYSSLLLGAAMLLGINSAIADDAKPAAPKEMPQGMRGRRFEMRGGQMSQMATARLAAKELRAYLENKTPENLAAFEKALNEAMKKDTAERKAKLEKELAELEKNQAKRAADLIAKVKSGEFKMPPAFKDNQRPGGRRDMQK